MIAVVDDDDDARLLIRHTIQRALPHAVISLFRGGEEALSSIARLPADLVVTNQKMPDMDGLTLITKIRESGSSVPIVMVSNSDHLEAEALRAGADAFFPASARKELSKIVVGLLSA